MHRFEPSFRSLKFFMIVVHECDDPTPSGITDYGMECGDVEPNAQIGKCLGSTSVIAWVNSINFTKYSLN